MIWAIQRFLVSVWGSGVSGCSSGGFLASSSNCCWEIKIRYSKCLFKCAITVKSSKIQWKSPPKYLTWFLFSTTSSTKAIKGSGRTIVSHLFLPVFVDLRLYLCDFSVHLVDVLQQFVFGGFDGELVLRFLWRQGGRDSLNLRVVHRVLQTNRG